MITALHPSTEDRAQARKYGLCWHPTVFKPTWACYDEATEPQKAPEAAPEPIPAQKTAPTTVARAVQVTFREHDVATELFKTGGTNTQIAKTLYLSEDTVKTHMKRLLARTGTATRSELLVAHYRGRIRLVPKAMISLRHDMIKRKTIQEDAL